MKGYKTIGTQKVIQKKYNCGQKGYERFLHRQKKKEIQRQAKITDGKKAEKYGVVFSSSIRQEEIP